MTELLDILDAFTMPLKIAWVIWLAWGIGQIFWYRHERKPQTASKRATAAVRKPFVSKPSVPERVGTRLITPEQVIPTQPPPVEAPFVEPTPALLEGPEVAELDRFVADFEMNSRQRRAQPHNGVAG